MNEPLTIYITRFPLAKSGGIEKATGYPHPLESESIIVASGRFKGSILSGDHWHTSETKARKYAEAYRLRIIETKRQELAELEAMTPFL